MTVRYAVPLVLRGKIGPEIFDDEANVVLCSAAAACTGFNVIERRGSKSEFLGAEEAWHRQGTVRVCVARKLVQVSKDFHANRAHEVHTLEMLH